ncbi:MAG: PIG-L family deacetylase [Phycisphaerales bacterium]|nr:PIG-L family deacetylase [Phycisphaerales bacterium]
MSKVLVVAPHPDDEVLGCGGTIRRMVQTGEHVTVAIVTRGTPLYPDAQVERVRAEAAVAAQRLGVHSLKFLDLPVTMLHLMPEHELNAAFFKLIRETEPDTLFLPFVGDRHEDHRQIFDAALVASRPDGRRYRVSRICCYETVSETHWAAPAIEAVFNPTWYVNIGATLVDKLDAMRCYVSQLEENIPARTIQAIEALARFRGSVVGMPAAEGFQIVRDLWD